MKENKSLPDIYFEDEVILFEDEFILFEDEFILQDVSNAVHTTREPVVNTVEKNGRPSTDRSGGCGIIIAQLLPSDRGNPQGERIGLPENHSNHGRTLLSLGLLLWPAFLIQWLRWRQHSL